MEVTREAYKSYKKESKNLLSYSKFKTIVEQINIAIIDEVTKGNLVTLTSLGTLKVKKKVRTFVKVDLVATKHKKEQLLKEGKSIYKQWKDEQGNIVNNGGIEYLTYYSNPNYLMFSIEDTNNYNHLYLNGNKYKFTPARGITPFSPTRLLKEREEYLNTIL
jgi:nucleoid DNA-binding protein